MSGASCERCAAVIASARNLPARAYGNADVMLLVANLAFPAKSVQELIALARAKSGQINYSSSGNGSPANLAGARCNYMASVDSAHVPYKGLAQATTDVIGGQIEIGFPSMTSSLPYARAGKLRALAMTAAQRSQLAPTNYGVGPRQRFDPVT